MKSLKTAMKATIIIGVVLSLIPLIIYCTQFGSSTFSSDLNIWSTFGSFVAGTVSPIIAIVNLALLVIISLLVANYDSHRHFNEFRYKAYYSLCKQFEETTYNSDKLYLLQDYLINFKNNHQFLFQKKYSKKFNLLIDSLIDATGKLGDFSVEYEEKIQKGEIKVMEFSNSFKKTFADAFSGFPRIQDEESRLKELFESGKQEISQFI